MISMTFDDLKSRATNLIKQVQGSNASELRFEIVEGESAIGGGAAPTSRLRTPLISMTHAQLSANQIEERIRRSDPPVIARIEDDRVLLDLRTVSLHDEASLVSTLAFLEQWVIRRQ
jgi:L-seryl-tRNA(Ser) seleniumtransferase